jgi:hypothetical protein
MHVVLALKILSLLPGTIDKKEFIVGTSFPDIRYLAHLDREQTHFEPVSWNDVMSCPSSFRAGMLFHNMVDILRIRHFEPDFYDRQAPDRYSSVHVALFPLIMKMAEDQVLYEAVYDWHEIMGYFDTIYETEKALCPDPDVIQKWHTLLQNYFSERPSVASIDRFLKGVGNLSFYTYANYDAVGAFDDLTSNPNFIKKIQEFYSAFESFLSSELLETPIDKIS